MPIRILQLRGRTLDMLLPNVVEAPSAEFDKLRYRLGVPEGVDDLLPGKALPIESNIDYLGGISLSKVSLIRSIISL